jgi:parallel beta-helix repeat protein
MINPINRFLCKGCLLTLFALGLEGREINVPDESQSIQAAINSAKPGDVVIVQPGIFPERLMMKPDVTVRSDGDDSMGKLGLTRAEATILNHPKGMGPGVTMAEGATLDGFTITGVGEYNEALWQKHYATQGNQQKHEHIGAPGTAGIAASYNCKVTNNIVHNVGYTGIAIMGAKGRQVSPRIVANVCYRNMGGGIGSMNGSTAIIEKNICFENFYAGIGHNSASPVVRDNECYNNIRAGIGISEGSSPRVTGNHCYKNRRAGIGIRTGGNTRPIVEDNDCIENDMAGIGTEEHAMPVIRNNRCRANKLAGIGCRDGARPQILNNDCRENGAAGIGVESGANARIEGNLCKGNKTTGIGVRAKAEALILNNRLIDNAMVAIGVRNGSRATIKGNQMERKGGMPPMIAVLEDSQVEITENIIRGGGVAGILLSGTANINDNEFLGNGPRRGGPPNFAVWVRNGSEIQFNNNKVDRWRHALFASGAIAVRANDNRIKNFIGTAIVVKDAATRVEVSGNKAHSSDTKARTVDFTGPSGKIRNNELVKEEKQGKN